MKEIIKKHPKIIIAFAVLIVIILVFAVSKNKEKNKTENNPSVLSEEDAKKENLPSSGNSEPETSQEENKEEKNYTEYSNQAYNYSLKFPDNWHMNNDSSEKKLKETEDEEGNKFTIGGQTFWSNYSDISQYSPADKPDDFHLLALTVYKDEKAESIEDFADNLGFDSESEKNSFEINGLKGIEFIAPNLTEGSPRVAVIFQKENLFYVFNLAFIGGDKKIAEEMENITASFKLNN